VGLAWVVLLVGAVAYLNHRSSSPAAVNNSSPATAPAPKDPYGARIPVPQSALRVARQFLRDGVMRQDLAAAWTLAGPKLRAGYTRSRWLTGDIPIAQFPHSAFAKAGYKVSRSRQRDVLLLVYIFPRKGSHVEGWDYLVHLAPHDGAWRVTYWQPRGHEPPVPLAAQ
jgi:hypothetical protein